MAANEDEINVNEGIYIWEIPDKNVLTVCEPFGFLRTRDISHSELKPQRKWFTEQTGMSSDRNLDTN